MYHMRTIKVYITSNVLSSDLYGETLQLHANNDAHFRLGVEGSTTLVMTNNSYEPLREVIITKFISYRNGNDGDFSIMRDHTMMN